MGVWCDNDLAGSPNALKETWMYLMMMTLKASVARKAAGKGIGPKRDLAAMGIVTESTTKNNAFSCIT